jgi:hypothetical protein
VKILVLLAGFALWAIAFVTLYALQALGCAYDWPNHRLILGVVAAAFVIGMAWLAWQTPHWVEGSTTIGLAARWTNIAAVVASILMFFPALFVSICI